MNSIKLDAIGGFNQFLEAQQKAPGEANLTRVLFSDCKSYKVIDENVPIANVQPLTEVTYFPGGSTALLDAVGRTIESADKRIQALPEEAKPSKVIVAILTDGEENDSEKFSKSKIFEMIQTQQEKNKWEVLYLGANQDAFHEGAQMGIRAGNTTSFAASSKGVRGAYDRMSEQSLQYRSDRD